ncbi:MAG: CDP-alcohol phosphatidyltransferase family protein [Gammaproteobacteria bacterium]|nr:CDP-alcohol phosphatidyltransferase family protein [Gammaproteobacteria bacterium]
MTQNDSIQVAGAIPAPAQAFPLVRHLSCRLSRLLVRTAITPNQVTGLSLLSGLACAACFAFGGYAVQVLGALLLTVSYTLDNCDGEIARVKGLSSEFGAKFDDMVDWMVDAAFFLGLGYGVWKTNGMAVWFWFGAAAAAGAFIDYVIDLYKYRQDAKKEDARSREEEATDPKKPEDVTDWLIYIFHKLSRADFCLIILVLALLNVTWILLPFAAIGAQVYWITDLFDRARGWHT